LSVVKELADQILDLLKSYHRNNNEVVVTANQVLGEVNNSGLGSGIEVKSSVSDYILDFTDLPKRRQSRLISKALEYLKKKDYVSGLLVPGNKRAEVHGYVYPPTEYESTVDQLIDEILEDSYDSSTSMTVSSTKDIVGFPKKTTTSKSSNGGDRHYQCIHCTEDAPDNQSLSDKEGWCSSYNEKVVLNDLATRDGKPCPRFKRREF